MEDMAYIGRCRQCKGVLLAVGDNPQHKNDVGRDVARVIRHGGYVERMTVEEGREALRQWCQCASAQEEEN